MHKILHEFNAGDKDGTMNHPKDKRLEEYDDFDKMMVIFFGFDYHKTISWEN